MTMNADTKICCLCGKPFTEFGNNPAPFEGERCCDDCDNRIVIPERIRLEKERRSNESRAR